MRSDTCHLVAAGFGSSLLLVPQKMSVQGGTYSVPELDRIVSDIFELKQGGSACASFLPEEEVGILSAGTSSTSSVFKPLDPPADKHVRAYPLAL